MRQFSSLHDDARLWIWIADRPLTTKEQHEILDSLDAFFEGWSSHGTPIVGGAAFQLNQVLVLAGEIREGEISGCGIDKSARILDSAAAGRGFEWASSLDVAVVSEAGDAIDLVAREEFLDRIRTGKIRRDTLIVAKDAAGLGMVREYGLVRPADQTWASRYFHSDSPVAS